MKTSAARLGILGMALVGLTAFWASPVHASETDYPSKPVKIVVASAAGGILDTVARQVALGLSVNTGQQFIVENKPGAGGIIGTETVAKAAPDGYTAGHIATSHAINPSVYAKLPYDTMVDLAPVTQTVNLTNLLVVKPDLPANNLRELIALAKAKPGIRIINTARGGIVVEADLADAIKAGHVQGAGLDVFEKEPTTESPLFSLDSVVVAPHLGASTAEAQDKAGATIAEQVQLALAGDFVPFAVNVAAGEVSEVVRPFMGLAEQLGRFLGGLVDGQASNLEITYNGEIAGSGTKILTLSVLKGLFGATSDDAVSYVNAPALAAERGLEIEESSSVTSHEYVNLITVSAGGHSVSGTLAGIGTRVEPRVVSVDDHSVEVPPSAHMLVVRNDDRPGMIGVVGQHLGAAGISISSMAVGPSHGGPTALMVLATDQDVPTAVADALAANDGIFDLHRINL